MIEKARSLFSVLGIEDPYPIYAELRDKAPVHLIPELGIWVLSRFDDIQVALRAPDAFSSVQPLEMRRPIRNQRLLDAMREMAPLSLISSDPPDHTRLRKLVSGVFSPGSSARMEARIRAIAVELISAIAPRDQLDMMEDLAIPLPVTVISELLGVDVARRADFKRWSDDLLLGSGFDADLSEEEVDRLIASRREMLAYFEAMIAQRRATPKKDLIGDLVRAEVEQEMLTPEEVLSMTVLLLIAGNETTTNLIGNGTLELCQHPEDERRLRADPSLIPGFLEEVLRHCPPVRMISRRTARDVTLHGVTIPANQPVFLLLDSANRDPRQFANPDRFDITRRPNNQITFGLGIHFCVGAPLARVEGRVTFEEVFRRLPPFSLQEGPLEWQGGLGLRGLTRLPLRLHREASTHRAA